MSVRAEPLTPEAFAPFGDVVSAGHRDVGGLLGLAGAWLAVARHLSDIEPR